jgi:riboflavin synthase
MFTGLVLGVALVEELSPLSDGAKRLILNDLNGLLDKNKRKLGQSISINGVCLSLVDCERLAFDISNETLACTSLGSLKISDKVNIELSLKMGDELGGHLVSGHIDGVASVQSVEHDGDFCTVRFKISGASLHKLAPFIAAKGSIAVNGVSLTVNDVLDTNESCIFSVMLIPQTLLQTNLGSLERGSSVNIEIDLIARYLGRITKIIGATHVEG